LAIARIQCTGEQEEDLGGVFTLTAERLPASPLALYLWGIAPLGGGADGEGDGTFPAPVARASPGTSFPANSRITPTSRRVPRLLPPPRGGGQCMASDRIPCTGERSWISVGVFTLTAERLSPP